MSTRTGKPGPKTKSAFRENVEAVLWAAVLYLGVSHFVMQAFRIPSESMCDTLLVGDYLFANKFLYGAKVPFVHMRLPAVRAPRRGDIIVFDFPPDPRQQFIKRCVGVGGDTIEVRHKDLYVNGKRPDEPYIKHVQGTLEEPAGISPRDNFGPYVVPKGMLFMMGDNRDNSLDSRFWGPVKMDLVQGPAMFTYFSTSGDHWWNALLHIRPGRMFRAIR
jgi:signal peptidase I